MQRLLLIVGMYRSGSSALAHALAALGYYPGSEADLRAGDEFNEGGYWENQRIMRLNDMITAQFGLGDFACQCLPENWQDFPATPHLLQHAASQVQSLYSGREFAGWKDPRTTRLLPFWLSVLELAGFEPQFLAPIRDPVAVAQSLRRRDHIELTTGIGLWVHYNLCALHFLRSDQVRLINYEDLIRHPREALIPVLSSLGHHSDALKWSAVETALRAELSHHEAGQISGIAIAEQLLPLLRQIATNPDGPAKDVLRSRVEQLWNAWAAMISLTAQRYHPPAKLALSGSRIARATVHPCRETPIRLAAEPGPGRVFSLSLGEGPGITYLRNPRAIAKSGEPLPLEMLHGGEGQAERLSSDLWRFVVYGPGAHLLIKGPDCADEWAFEADVFAQTGRDYAHAAFKGLLDHYHCARTA
jgi:hypothetical protein